MERNHTYRLQAIEKNREAPQRIPSIGGLGFESGGKREILAIDMSKYRSMRFGSSKTTTLIAGGPADPVWGQRTVFAGEASLTVGFPPRAPVREIDGPRQARKHNVF